MRDGFRGTVRPLLRPQAPLPADELTAKAMMPPIRGASLRKREDNDSSSSSDSEASSDALTLCLPFRLPPVNICAKIRAHRRTQAIIFGYRQLPFSPLGEIVQNALTSTRRALGMPSPSSSQPGPLRILASGTLFYTYTLSLPTHPAPRSSNANVRAHSYVRSRNGSACSVLTVLAQFQAGFSNEGVSPGAASPGSAGMGLGNGGVEGVWLIASLGGNDEGKEVLRELERAGVSTKYCKIWDGVGVPGAWVLHAGECHSA